MPKTTTTKFSIGDRVRVRTGMGHNSATKEKTGFIQEIVTPALGVKFDGMPMHKWYADEDLEGV